MFRFGVTSHTAPKVNCVDFSDDNSGLAMKKVSRWIAPCELQPSTAQVAGSLTDSAENCGAAFRMSRLGARKPLPTEPRSASSGMGLNLTEAFGEKSLP